jgi:hypothetical protein
MARKFDIELNGIITLTYTDKDTGRRNQTQLQAVERKSNSCEDCFLQHYSCFRFLCNGATRSDKADIKFVQNDN